MNKHVSDFVERLKSDEPFRKAFQQAPATEREQFLIGHGYEFATDELDAAIGELDDADLANVSGGGVHCGEYGQCGQHGSSGSNGCSSVCHGKSDPSCGVHCDKEVVKGLKGFPCFEKNAQ